MKTTKKAKPPKTFAEAVGAALDRGRKVARKTARDHGTPIYFWRDGKIEVEKP